MVGACVPSNFMANRQVPKFSLNNCAQSFKKTFMCPKFCTNPVLKYTKCHVSTNLSNFLKLHLLYCQNLFALAPANRRFAEKIGLVGTLVGALWLAYVNFVALVLNLYKFQVLTLQPFFFINFNI